MLYEHKLLQEEDWSLPNGATLLNATETVRTHREVLDRIDQVCRMETATRDVFSHYAPRCRQEQVGMGDEYEIYDHSEETCDPHGFCQEEDVFVKKRDPVYGQVCTQDLPIYVKESYPVQRCENVRVTHQEPVVATRYTYTIQRWVRVRDVKENGSGAVNVRFRPGEDQRLDNEHYLFFLTFESDWPLLPVSRTQYERYMGRVGQAVTVNVQWFPQKTIVLKE